MMHDRYHKIIGGFLFFTFSFIPLSFSQANDQITITTYYPSPYGSYNEVEIYNRVILKDPAGSTATAQIRTDTNGNFLVNSPQPFYQIVFEDVNKPFCYLQAYSPSGGTTTCASGYVAANFLDSNKIPVNPVSLPPSGFIVCIRGWE